jgi:hypothetical protein
MRRHLPLAVAAYLLCAGLSYGDEVDVKLNPTGYASFSVGQIVNAENPETAEYLSAFTTPQLNHLLLQNIITGFNLETTFKPLPVSTNLGIEMKTYIQTPRSATDNLYGQDSRYYYFAYLTRADFIYSSGPEFNLDFGYFPFKYNSDSRNLGEYLFRTGMYQPYIVTNFDFPLARLAGLCVSGSLPDSILTWDGLLTMDISGATIGDLNLTGIASYKPFKPFEIGAGVSFCSFISANSDRTHPAENAPWVSNDASDMYVSGGDTQTYTFAGTKIMARASFDFKELLPDLKQNLGENDLKIYSEAAILGVENYPHSIAADTVRSAADTMVIYGTDYSKLLQRLPVMFGINLPTFKVLNILNFEAEWFGCNYPDAEDGAVGLGLPSEQTYQGGSGDIPYPDSAKQHWKWSVYAKKTFAGHFDIVGQVACDHYRWELNDYGQQAQFGGVEAFREPSNYYYIIKLAYNF